MKAVILAGGYGSRLSEETSGKPKPMVEIGGSPILWHIMKSYEAHGIKDFIICLGYMGYAIKEYFAQYFLHMADVTFDLAQNEMKVHEGRSEDWRVTLINTGLDTMTGGRIKRILPYIGDEDFCCTYGDGVSDVDISKVIALHESNSLTATITAVCPPSRYGDLIMNGDKVTEFAEKPEGGGGWINGGFFVFSPAIGELIDSDNTVLETDVLPKLALQNELGVYRHDGFWQSMDTIRDRNLLEDMWKSGNPKWRTWE